MAYTITLADGLTQLVTISDRAILGPLEIGAPSGCSLNLVGRGSVAYGLAMVTNDVWLAQNFAAPTPPVQPLQGQLWYKTEIGNATLQLYNVAEQWVQVATSDRPWFGHGDITVYDDFGHSATLGANASITLTQTTTNAVNAVQLTLGSDRWGLPDLMVGGPGGANTVGAVWHASNLSPFDLALNNTATGNNRFQGSTVLAGPASATTPASDDNSTTLATTAFVLNQAATSLPLIDGTAAAGTSKRWARGDHVHPTDTSRAPLFAPRLTGDTGTNWPAIVNTPPLGDNTTKIASTAFVMTQIAHNPGPPGPQGPVGPQGPAGSGSTGGPYLPLAGGTLTGNLGIGTNASIDTAGNLWARASVTSGYINGNQYAVTHDTSPTIAFNNLADTFTYASLSHVVATNRFRLTAAAFETTGTIDSTGNIVANAGRLRGAIGATAATGGNGTDAQCAVLQGDFATLFGQNFSAATGYGATGTYTMARMSVEGDGAVPPTPGGNYDGTTIAGLPGGTWKLMGVGGIYAVSDLTSYFDGLFQRI